MVVIDLFPWEYERAFAVGIQRFVANWGRQNAPHYDQSRMESDRRANAAAAICEAAVARFTNEYWHGHVWHFSERHLYRHLADVGEVIEVRRVRTQPGPTVRAGDAGRIVWGARVLEPEWTSVELLGWVHADDALAGGSSSVVVPVSALHKPAEWPRTNHSGVLFPGSDHRAEIKKRQPKETPAELDRRGSTDARNPGNGPVIDLAKTLRPGR